MKFDLRELPVNKAYQLMIASILPRPIAWVATQSSAGVNNIAPFSFFNGVTANPPTLLFSVVNDRHGNKKDTAVNIEDTGEFVVNVVTEQLCDLMVASSHNYEHGISEFEACGILAESSEQVRPLRVAKAPVSFECRTRQIVTIGEGPLAANIIIGDIVLMLVQDDCLDSSQNILSSQLNLIGRMGANDYVSTHAVFEGAKRR
jgi:flavin reductase (DIM6/NTAB) family NADH-FMN oxidoreductase RutF